MCIKIIVVLCTLCVSHSLANSVDDSDSTASPDTLSWSCVNNASCLAAVSQDVLQRLRTKKPVQLGVITIDPVGHDTTTFTGRSMSFLDILNGNALKVPVGPMLLSVQRSDEYKNYLEVALLRKSNDEGRQVESGHQLGGGHGGGFGGGHGGGLGGKLGGHKDRKQLQMYIPLFLAFNAVGWMMLAMKVVAVLTVKALLVSKLAFVVAATVVIKKMMDSATEKMMQSHHFEHPEPIMMPYNMEYSMPGHSYHGAEMGANELYSLHMAAAGGHDAAAAQGGGESVAAESSVNQVIGLGGTQQGQQGLVSLPAPVAKVKRQDMWAGFRKRPLFYNYLAAARQPAPIYAQ